MTTTVVKTIGTTGDYSTLQAWEDAAPANLVTVDQIWQGQCQNQIFATTLVIGGSTSSALCYKQLTTVAGASFSDNASASTNALRYNTANGAAIQGSLYGANLVDVAENYAQLVGLQIKNTSGLSISVGGNGNNVTLNKCIISGSTGTTPAYFAGSSTVVINTLFVTEKPSAGYIARFQGGDLYNCSFIAPSDLVTPAAAGVNGTYGTVNLYNCVVFGAHCCACHYRHGSSHS